MIEGREGRRADIRCKCGSGQPRLRQPTFEQSRIRGMCCGAAGGLELVLTGFCNAAKVCN